MDAIATTEEKRHAFRRFRVLCESFAHVAVEDFGRSRCKKQDLNRKVRRGSAKDAKRMGMLEELGHAAAQPECYA